MEDRSRRHRELPPAAGALPADWRLGKRVDLGDAAMQAERLASVRREANPFEDTERLNVRHAKHRR